MEQCCSGVREDQDANENEDDCFQPQGEWVYKLLCIELRKNSDFSVKYRLDPSHQAFQHKVKHYLEGEPFLYLSSHQ